MSVCLRGLPLLALPVLMVACGQQSVSFVDDVQPILKDSCLSCHTGTGEGVEASKYALTDYESVMQGTTYGPVVVPGSRLSSALYLVIAGKTDPAIRMPPHHENALAEGRGASLSAQSIETIGLWIDQGARNN